MTNNLLRGTWADLDQADLRLLLRERIGDPGQYDGNRDVLHLPLARRSEIAAAAASVRLPAIYTFREFVQAGGLMSYGADLPALYQRAAGYVDKILKGAKPGELPLQSSEKFELAVNLKTAKALNLTISEAFLLRADEVIE